MTYAEIKDLLNNGFTPQQIAELNNSVSTTTPPETPTTTPPETPTTKPPETHTTTHPETPTTSDSTTNVDRLTETINKLINTLQVSNLMTTTVNTPDKETEVDKIMAGIIRPERKDGK